MTQEYLTLDTIRGMHIAHTDAGDFFMHEGNLLKEFYVKGKITKARAGLFFLSIDGERFTAHKQEGFEVGEEVGCIVIPSQNKETSHIEFVIKGLEKVR